MLVWQASFNKLILHTEKPQEGKLLQMSCYSVQTKQKSLQILHKDSKNTYNSHNREAK